MLGVTFPAGSVLMSRDQLLRIDKGMHVSSFPEVILFLPFPPVLPALCTGEAVPFPMLLAV